MSFRFPTSVEPEPLSDDELEAALKSQIETSSGFYGDVLGTERAEQLSVYMRNGYREDLSRQEQDLSTTVDSTAQDVVDFLMSELLRIFTGSDEAVSFKANSEDDVDQAEQETDTVRHVFYTQNDGYWALFCWLWDGLVQTNGFVKCYVEERVENRVERYSGLSATELTMLMLDFETDNVSVEILEQSSTPSERILMVEDVQQSLALQHELLMADEVRQAGDQVMIMGEEIDVKLRLREIVRDIKVIPVPPDEIIISARWNQVDLKDCPFVGHRYSTTQSDLIAGGFDPDQVRSLPESEDEEFGSERTTRFDGLDYFESENRTFVDESTRPILVTDCYAYIDRDGDGIAELVKARIGGADGQLLRYRDGTVAVEEIEETEIHAWTPFIIPHRHFGECPVERVADIQRNRSVMEREMMDNAVLSNNAGSVIDMTKTTPDTIDDALNYRPGRVVRTNDVNAVVPFKIQATFGDSIPVLDYWRDRAEARTGATRLSQGLTGDALPKNVPGVVISQMQEAAMSKVDMIARNFAETGYKSLFKHIHALLRRHQDKELAFQVRGQWVQADPRHWGERANVSVGVGIGANGKLAKIDGFAQILSKQIEGLEIGLTDAGKIFNTLSDMAAALGFKNATRYFTDPAVEPMPEQPEEKDPNIAIAEAEVETGRMKALTDLKRVQQKELADQRNADLDQRKLAMDAREIILKDDRERDIAVLKAMMEEQAHELAALQAIVRPPGGVER